MQVNNEIIEKLSKVELFSDFNVNSPEDFQILSEICQILETKNFTAGEIIIQEGDIGDVLFILYEGSVQVRRNTPSNEQFAVVNLNASQNVFFGEVALVDKDKRSASVIAVENCKTLCIDGDSFKSLCDKIPLLGYRVIYKIAKRIALSLRKSNRDFMILYEALLDEVHGE